MLSLSGSCGAVRSDLNFCAPRRYSSQENGNIFFSDQSTESKGGLCSSFFLFSYALSLDLYLAAGGDPKPNEGARCPSQPVPVYLHSIISYTCDILGHFTADAHLTLTPSASDSFQRH